MINLTLDIVSDSWMLIISIATKANTRFARRTALGACHQSIGSISIKFAYTLGIRCTNKPSYYLSGSLLVELRAINELSPAHFVGSSFSPPHVDMAFPFSSVLFRQRLEAKRIDRPRRHFS